MHKGNRILIHIIIAELCPSNKTESAIFVSLICSLPPEDLHSELILNKIHILTISHCSTLRVSATPTVFDAGI